MTFIPTEFFWKDSYENPQKVQEVCDILNKLTNKQKEAVKFYTRSKMDEESWNNNTE